MGEIDVESEFYRLAAEFGAVDEHEEGPEEGPWFDWRVALFIATYLTATAAGYFYIGRAVWRAIRG